MVSYRTRLGIFRAVVGACALWTAAGAPAAPPAAPDLTRQQWHERLQWDTAECPLQRDDLTDSGVTVTARDATHSLIMVECERWAYQGTYRFYVRTGEAVVPLEFEQFESPDTGRLERYRSPLVTGVPLLNAQPSAIDILRKYRGAADCGQFLRYRITDGAAVLKSFRVRECAALPSGRPVPPNRWPTRNVPR